MTMAYAHYDRLTALDDSFLEIEDATSHMHIGAVGVFEAGPLRTRDGGIDVARVRALMAAELHRIPRYRQRLARVPFFDQPVWVDDARFNLDYHLRHTQLPHPGGERLLKRLAGRLMSQQLDRGKPLWEMWIVEGVDPEHFAIITKAHHCMIDGVGSVELMASVMRPTPDDPRPDAGPPRWFPRPVPTPRALLLGELCHRAATPISALGAVRKMLRHPRETIAGAYETAVGVVEAMAGGLKAASPTPLNVPIGPHRRFDWAAMDLAAVREVRARLGGTVNDVVLAAFAGALRRFLYRRGVGLEGIDFRAMLPVNVRAGEQLGNHVAMLVARLPLDVRDAGERYARVVAETQRAKASHQALGMQAIEELSDRTFTTLLVQFARLAARAQPYNVVVTNVPGPAFPVYVLGARMVACYPVVPLFQNQALGLALFSYDGRLYWGFNADWDEVPDLHELVVAVESEFEMLRTAAQAAGAPVGSAGASHALASS
jgi:WS/DGAT/MGAT family acyltransferase